MGIYETFSKRMKRLSQQGQTDVYQYTELPEPFRVQVVHIWKDAIPLDTPYGNESSYWQGIHDVMARELGVFRLPTLRPPPSTRNPSNYDHCVNFFLSSTPDNALDIIELSFRVINTLLRTEAEYNYSSRADSAISELNHRFREHNIGYQFENGELIRVDSQFVHAEVVKPALSLLHDSKFRGAEEEFIKAYDHYRHGRIQEAMVEALKAFESTMKAICTARKWPYSLTASAKPLLDILFDKGLISPAMQSHFSGLRTTLEARLPNVRNKNAGHGQGAGEFQDRCRMGCSSSLF